MSSLFFSSSLGTTSHQHDLADLCSLQIACPAAPNKVQRKNTFLLWVTLVVYWVYCFTNRAQMPTQLCLQSGSWAARWSEPWSNGVMLWGGFPWDQIVYMKSTFSDTWHFGDLGVKLVWNGVCLCNSAQCSKSWRLSVQLEAPDLDSGALRGWTARVIFGG